MCEREREGGREEKGREGEIFPFRYVLWDSCSTRGKPRHNDEEYQQEEVKTMDVFHC